VHYKFLYDDDDDDDDVYLLASPNVDIICSSAHI